MNEKKYTLLFLLLGNSVLSFDSAAEPTYVKQLLNRCYLISRVSKAVASIQKKNLYISCTNQEIAQFSNREIVYVLHQLSEHNNSTPFFNILSAFNRFQFISSQNFDREIVMLVLLIHYKIRKKEIRNQNLSDLPLEQMLEAIDILTHDLPILLDQYEYFSDQTWEEWLKKYWYVPVLITTIITLRILIKFK